MATSSQTIIPGFVLTGSTPGNSTAPVTFTLNGISLGTQTDAGGFEYTAFRNTDGTYTVEVAGRVISRTVPAGQFESLLAGLRPAAGEIERTIRGQATTTSSPTTTTTTTTTPRPTTSPTTTTNPSNSLPLGDQIDDIYDPNLTPEQVASLSPGERQSRADVLADEAAGNVTGPENANEDIVVVAPRIDYGDWRVKLSLADGANYLYKAEDPGILAPLAQTKGVIFPYTPQISVNYAATYEPSTIIHSNYKVYQYSNSSVDSVTITCDFTAQDTREANYLLAVIHFFRSATKMFFGQDENPRAGTPPPLCFLRGMGSYQFSEHPLAISGFSYNLPNDVDYIKTVGPTISGLPLPVPALSVTRLPDNVLPGGLPAPPDFTQIAASPQQDGLVTWVPTKIQLSITAIPIVSRSQMSQVFSLREYANGNLLNVRNSPDGGFW